MTWRARETGLRWDRFSTPTGSRAAMRLGAGAVAGRVVGYRYCPDVVMWVWRKAARNGGVRTAAAMLRETALFTTLQEALRNPHGPIWIAVEGERAALPRSPKGSPKGEGKS